MKRIKGEEALQLLVLFSEAKSIARSSLVDEGAADDASLLGTLLFSWHFGRSS